MPKINKVNVNYTYFVFGNLQIAPSIEMTCESCSLLDGKQKKVQQSNNTRFSPAITCDSCRPVESQLRQNRCCPSTVERCAWQVDLLPPHLRMRVRQQAIVAVRTSHTAIGHCPGQTRRSSTAIVQSSMANGTGFCRSWRVFFGVGKGELLR